MRLLLPCFVAVMVPAFAQSGDCSKPFQASQNDGGQVSMTLRAGRIDVVGTKGSAIRVTCRIDREEDAGRVKITFAAGRIRVYGGPDNGVSYRIELPERTGLLIRATAGDMEVKGITGDKDVELRAGNLSMEVGDAKDYKVAEASVMAGNLTARPFGSQKDGLFRSFRKEYSGGRYRLRVELMAGNLTLK